MTRRQRQIIKHTGWWLDVAPHIEWMSKYECAWCAVCGMLWRYCNCVNDEESNMVIVTDREELDRLVLGYLKRELSL